MQPTRTWPQPSNEDVHTKTHDNTPSFCPESFLYRKVAKVFTWMIKSTPAGPQWRSLRRSSDHNGGADAVFLPNDCVIKRSGGTDPSSWCYMKLCSSCFKGIGRPRSPVRKGNTSRLCNPCSRFGSGAVSDGSLWAPLQQAEPGSRNHARDSKPSRAFDEGHIAFYKSTVTMTSTTIHRRIFLGGSSLPNDG